MKLHPKQSEFVSSTKKKKLLNWGRRSGKTFAVGYDVYPDLWNRDDARVSYYAPNRDDARDISWEDFKDLFEPITLSLNETLLEIKVKNKYYGQEGRKGTSLLKLYGWEAVKNSDKGRGVENDVVVLDECAFFPMFVEKFEKVIEPTLLTSKGRLVVTSTPNGFNHFYDMYNHALTDDEWFVSHATSYDNPHNDPLDLDKLRENKSPDAFAQEYMADFRKQTGLVYKEFDRVRHMSPCDDIRGATYRGCVDFGFTNPTAAYTVIRDHDNNYFITDEYYKTEQTHDQIIQVLNTRQVESWYPDPAEAPAIALMRRKGMRVNEVSKDVNKGIDTVRNLLVQNRLFIDPECKNLLNEIESYRYKEQRADKNAPEEPVKENDHGLDAIRYALFMWENNLSSSVNLKNHYQRKRMGQAKIYGAVS